MDRIADSGSADGGSNPSGHTPAFSDNGKAFLFQAICRYLAPEDAENIGFYDSNAILN